MHKFKNVGNYYKEDGCSKRPCWNWASIARRSNWYVWWASMHGIKMNDYVSVGYLSKKFMLAYISNRGRSKLNLKQMLLEMCYRTKSMQPIWYKCGRWNGVIFAIVVTWFLKLQKIVKKRIMLSSNANSAIEQGKFIIK